MDAIRLISNSLDDLRGAQDAAMVAYRLRNTVSRFGTVTRGICMVKDGHLDGVTETYNIRLMPDKSIQDGNSVILHPETPVSMNMWGFHPDILPIMEKYFQSFLEKLEENDMSSECLLPHMVDHLISSKALRMAVADVCCKWFGLTHKDDRLSVSKHLRELCDNGVYPPNLWGNNQKWLG